MTGPGPIIFVAVLGAMVGSFLNVCIYRLPIKKSIVWPASACAKCGRLLAWFENIPVVSWTLLRGRCRTCKKPISSRYPLVESLTALMFAAAFWYYGPSWLFVSRILLGCALIVLFAVDLEHFLLPDLVTLPGIVVGFLISAYTGNPGWKASLIGIIAGGGGLWLMAEAWSRLRNVEAMGFGDVKMLAMIGAFLGWQLTFVTVLLGTFAGSALGLTLILTKRGGLQTALPFGTFLALGAALAATVGQPLLDWYSRFL